VQGYWINRHFNQPSTGPPQGIGSGGNTGGALFSTVVFTPKQISDALGNFNANATLDTKFYLKQVKNYGIITNNSNVPIRLMRMSCVSRMAIPFSEQPNINQMLNQDTYDCSITWLGPITTSNRAQRYLKFLKTKYYSLQPMQMLPFKMNKKWKNSRLINKDKEGDDANYLTNKGQLIYYWKIIPNIQQYHGTAAGQVSGIGPAEFSVNVAGTVYLTYRYPGQNDPQTSISEVPMPTAAETGPDRAYSDDIETVIKNGSY